MLSEQEVMKAANFRLVTSFQLSAFSVLLFDIITTFSREFDLVWRGGAGIVAFLYYLSRYPLLVGWFVNLILLLQTGSISPQGCTSLFRLSKVMMPLSLMGTYSLMVLRTYAICERNFKVLITLGILSAASIVPTLVLVATNTCTSGFSKVDNVENILGTVLGVVFDTTVILLTLRRTFGIAKLGKMHGRQRQNLTNLVLSQGVERYILVWVLGIALVTSNQLLPGSRYNIFLPLTLSLESIILCHFFLDLRDSARVSSPTDCASDTLATFYAGLHETTHDQRAEITE